MRKKDTFRILTISFIILSLCCLFVGCSENTVSTPLGEFEAEPVYYTLEYQNSENGTLEGELTQSILQGENGSSVKAVANKGYVFVGWSDGILTAKRTDKGVSRDILVHPIFVKSGTEYTVKYETYMNGKLIDSQKLSAKAGKKVTYTAPEAPFAYTYGEWSDGIVGAKRTDTYLAHDQTLVVNIVPRSLNEVPTIEIFTEDGKGVTSKKDYKTCKVTLTNTSAKDCFEEVSAQIRGRGNSSWNYEKKGFKIKFDKKRSMLGSDYAMKNWVFISNYGDKSLVRNMLAYDMSMQMSGLDFTTMHEYIDVYLDGEYYGLFLLCDRIDENKGRLDIETPMNADPSKMGYIVEIGMTDRKGVGVDTVAMERDKNRAYSVSYPDPDDPEFDPDVHLKYIGDYIDKCLEALSEENWDKICELIDIESFVDYYIIQEMFMNKDCFWRSVHFYKLPGGKLYIGPVWDFDQGIGNADDLFGLGLYDATPDCDINFVDNQFNSGKKAGSLWVADANTWYRRLLRNEEFVDLVSKRLGECRPIIEELIKRLKTDGSVENAYYTLYEDAMERNFDRWKIMGRRVWPNTPRIAEINTVKGQIDYVREWFTERYKILCDWYKVKK